MPPKRSARSKPPANLRERAERALRATRTDIARMPAEEVKRLVHELQVHQIELEMQNEELRQAQEELAQSEDRFRELYDFAPAGYLTLDAKGTILEANLAAARMLGIERARLTGRRLPDFIAGESQDIFYLHRRGLFADGKARVCELTLRGAKGTPLPAHLKSNRFADPASKAPRCRTILIDLTERARVEEALAASQAALQEANEKLLWSNDQLETRVAERTAQLRALTAELTEAEERERQRVADALHEGLLQLLTGALMNLADLKRHLREPAVPASFENVRTCLDEAIAVGRTLTYELYPPVLHALGLRASLEWLGQWHQQRHGLRVDVQLDQAIRVNETNLRITFYRAAHELLFNVVRHAGVPRARLRLRRERNGALCLVVSDTGAGFNPAAARAAEGTRGGFGLFRLRERVEALGGQLEIRSAPGRGCRVTVTIPTAPRVTAKPSPHEVASAKKPRRRPAAIA